MRWLPNISFSSPSSSPSSSSSSPRPDSFSESPSSPRLNDHDRSRFPRGLRIGAPRLTRQRKLRHLTDLGVANDRDRSTSSSSSSAFVRSPSTYSAVSRSHSGAAVPLPLPLPVPEGGGDPRGKNVGGVKESEERERDGRRDRDKDRDRYRADGQGDGLPLNSPSSSPFAFGRRDIRRISKKPDARTHLMLGQDLTVVDSPRDDNWFNIPTRSAPESPYASPVLSPQRKSTGDIFPRFNMAPNGNQVWSAPEMPLDISGLPPPAFLDYKAFSTENSPIHSPQNRSPGRSFSPLHTILSPDPLIAQRESTSPPLHPKLSPDPSLSNVHPLPLPPSAAVSSLSYPVPQATPKQEPSSLNSKWQKGKLIGRGTFGSVYVASNRETGALCAMKEVEIFPDDPKSAECIKQLEQEIKLLSHLQHANIVQYYGSEIVEDKFYIYLEYVHPGSINKYIRDHCGAITESVVRNFTRHILSGLAYLHSKKTVHRDIKGANLLVDASGVVKLADFGMAKHLTGQRADLSLKGSPYWMAPELMQAVMQKDHSTDLAFAVDIWSLGCTIIEMFTGKPPWSEYEGAAAMFKVMRDTPPIPESLSPEGKDFLRCCFRRNPKERPPATALLEHSFMRNSQQPNSPHADVSHLFNGMNITDKPHSRSEKEFKLDQAPVLPGSRSPKAEGETGQPYGLHREPPPKLALPCRYSPRSTLEALPSPSPVTNARLSGKKNGSWR